METHPDVPNLVTTKLLGTSLLILLEINKLLGTSLLILLETNLFNNYLVDIFIILHFYF
jgi:hypothetical protein